jgi:hypothetical protein
MKKILVVGAGGQIGSELVPYLRSVYGAHNVVATDVRECKSLAEDGPFEVLDALNPTNMASVVARHNIDTIFNLVALLSAVGERNPQMAWGVNMGALLNALEVARQNAVSNQVRVQFREQDVFSATPSSSSYDVIVSNPPYIAEQEKADMEANVLDWEPSIALFVPDSDPLLFYRKIAELGLEMLVPGGSLYFEINRAYGTMMKSMLENMGYRYVELRKDMFGNDRMIKAIK